MKKKKILGKSLTKKEHEKKNMRKILNQKENMRKTNMRKILNRKKEMAKRCIKRTKNI